MNKKINRKTIEWRELKKVQNEGKVDQEKPCIDIKVLNKEGMIILDSSNDYTFNIYTHSNIILLYI